MMIFIIILIVNLLFASDLAHAGNIDLHGFVQGNYASRITGEEIKDGYSDYILGEERLQAAVSGYTAEQGGGFFVKSDFFHDAIKDKSDIELREAYMDYSSGIIDIRAGRQIITWGAGDLLFINDTFPKDWTAFFSGRPMEYLKIGSDGFNIRLSSDIISAEAVVVPFFKGDNLPASDRFFLFDPFSDVSNKTITEPKDKISNTELSLRVYRNIAGFDTSFYLYKGFYRSPGFEADSMLSPSYVRYLYPELAVYGMSLQGNFAGGVLSLEGGYYDSLNDRKGNNGGIENSMIKILTGYSRQMLWEDFTAGFQYYGEYMMSYDEYLDSIPADMTKKDRYRQVVTMRLTQFLKYQTIRLSLFTFYSPTDEDYYLIPEIRYSLSDEMWASLGGNIFGGKKDTTFFGQFDKNDNINLAIRYEF